MESNKNRRSCVCGVTSVCDVSGEGLPTKTTRSATVNPSLAMARYLLEAEPPPMSEKDPITTVFRGALASFINEITGATPQNGAL